MALRLCTVNFKSATGIIHGVDVEAETLYEAAGLALARLKKESPRNYDRLLLTLMERPGGGSEPAQA